MAFNPLTLFMPNKVVFTEETGVTAIFLLNVNVHFLLFLFR